MSRRTLRSSLGLTALVVVLGAMFFEASAIGTPVPAGSPHTPQLAHSGPFPITITTPGGTVHLVKAPNRIVSLSPTATEDLFAIGAGHQVVAVDSDSDYPLAAPRTSLSAYTPNVEAVAKYRPDLVVVSAPGAFVTSMTKLGVPVLVEGAAANLSAAYNQLAQLGQATGQAGGAKRVVATMKQKIAALLKGAPHFGTAPTYYYELDQTYYTVTSSTFVGSLMAKFGLRNIADKAKGASSGYPQLSPEYIVKSNPTFVFLADTICCGQSAKTIAARPGWKTISTVKLGNIVALNDDVASRWGPRIVTLMTSVEHALANYKRHLAD